MNNYIYVTQNETPYRLLISKKTLSDLLLEISWTYNFFNCKKICRTMKNCMSYILLSLNYQENQTFISNLKKLPAKKITIWKKLRGCIVIQQEFHINKGKINLDFIDHKSSIQWIKQWIRQQKCLSCGRIYSTNHSCTYNRSSFYYHQIASSKKFWENIHFQPIGENQNTLKLFLVYDVETYTCSDSSGTTLQPVLLCFSIFGDDQLTTIAKQEITKDELIQQNENVYFWHCPSPNVISHNFKLLRENILRKLTEKLINHILTPENKEILEEYKKKQQFESIFQICPMKNEIILSLVIKPIFLEFYIVGHNIQSFDEILLATQVLNTENFPYQPFLNIDRNFIPRQGKILFNDITISFPNPEYFIEKKEQQYNQEILAFAKEGQPHYKNTKNFYVKSMVRDTYQMTHTSLRNAALAYNLSISKGTCPFKAVNDFYSLGTYKQDQDTKFPDITYWSSTEEYAEELNIWKSKNIKQYNLEKELLEYCCRDVKITAELTSCLLNTFNQFVQQEFNLNCNFNLFKRPTISSNSHAIFRQIHFKNHGHKINTLPNIVAPSEEMYSFVRQSVRGGRCYPTYLGIFQENLYVYDICGMYASALTHPMPYGIPVGLQERDTEIEKLNNILGSNKQLSYFKDIKPMIVSIDAFPPPREKLDPLPPICSKKSGRLCWTNEPLHEEVVTSIDIITLHNRGWKVKILKHPLNTVFPEWNTCCKEYVQANITAKERATSEGNNVKRAISKLLSNALYGSFATKEDNNIIVFEQSITPKIQEKLQNNELQIENICCIPTNQLPNTEITDLQYYQSKSKLSEERASFSQDDELTSPFDPEPDESRDLPTSQSQVKIATYKPFKIIDVTSDCLTIYMLKATKEFPTNKRYPTQLASFVLAWTRAFVSEWANILYSENQDTDIEKKPLKAIYGDTDSFFLTELGHNLMQTSGKHRLKTKTSPLIYNPKDPMLTWAVECETNCNNCNKPAYCPESIFLSPKFQNLKKIPQNFKSPQNGKLRAKGHSTVTLTFDILRECFNYHKSCTLPARKFTTERTALKRTLHKPYGQFKPFTIHEIKLIRELRPWHDPTLAFISENILIPYDLEHRNPRPSSTFLLTEFDDI
ncbi:DNA polymerase [Siadenovirus carbocapituli]|uniref:DNA polymerase n=1 Tax=Siadenovirus sp. TaxID=2671519 RepID=A0A9E6UQH5_9ADEN|nr:DNA polymerase [Siadenovirus sp.]